MHLKVCILLSCFITLLQSLSGQCPDSDSLWRKFVNLRDIPNLSPSEKLPILFNEEARIKNCAGNEDSSHALLLRVIGIMYFKQADYLKTVQYYRQSINMINVNAAKSSVNLKHLIGCYYWLSVFYDSLDNIFEKQKALDSCVFIALRLKSMDISGIRALYARVEYLFELGDYYRSIDYAKRCQKESLNYIKANKGKDYRLGVSLATSSMNWEVNAHLILKNYKAAEKLLEDKIQDCKNTGLRNYLGTLYTQSAEVQLQKGSFEKALTYFKEAFSYERVARNYMNCKIIMNEIGYNIYFKHFQDYDLALYYYRKALTFKDSAASEKREDAFESLNVLGNIALVFVQKGIYDSAFYYFQSAFNQIKVGLTDEDLLNTETDLNIKAESNSYILDLLLNKGDAFLNKYKNCKQINALLEAIRVYKVTDHLLDKIKQEQSDLKSKLFWRSDSRRLYEHAIEASYLSNNFDIAFYFFEKSRAVLLNDQLNEQQWIKETDIMKQTQVKKRINWLEGELRANDTASVQYAKNQDELFSQKQDLYRVEQAIKTTNPLYYQSFLDTSFVTLLDVKNKLLVDHHALLEHFEGDSAVYSLLVTRGRIYLNKTDKKDFDSTAKSYNSYLSNPSLLNGHFKNYIKTASHLYQLIFQNNEVPIGRIIISPDGQYFPFEALITSSSSADPVYFLSDHAVSYTYSARYLLTHFSVNSSKSEGDFLGVAPVKYSSGSPLTSLEGSDLSLNKIGSYFSHANNLVNVDASRSNFQRQFSNYKIIQLYTHASDSSSHGEPVIYFADSDLYLSDLIPETKPQTRLIVLSACETGTGKFYQGEGVFSFNRGFASLGIPASITNLWDVENKSTYQITELFYKYLSKGLPIDIALQKAKLEFIQNASRVNQLPYYWAASILAGKSDAIVNDKPFPWKDLLAILSLTGLSFFAWKKWSKK